MSDSANNGTNGIEEEIESGVSSEFDEEEGSFLIFLKNLKCC